MNTFKRKALAAAVLAGLGATSAEALYRNPDNHGQVLIFPYYTANSAGGNAFNTYLSVVNHGVDAKALRVRFREGRNGGGALLNILSIVSWIHAQTQDALQVEEGSLYPALYRMERDGWIEADWGKSELGRKAKFYNITDKGRRQLRADAKDFATFIAAISPLLLPS